MPVIGFADAGAGVTTTPARRARKRPTKVALSMLPLAEGRGVAASRWVQCTRFVGLVKLR